MSGLSNSPRPIGIGLFGASPVNPGWGVLAHLPSIWNSRDFELRAVATSRPESAERAAEAFRVPAYTDPAALLARPDVDMAVIAVKVPQHRAVIEAALDAGKMVFSEWPLARDLPEASLLAARAAASGLRTFVGLQGRHAPAIRQARALVAAGYVGNVLATTLVGSAMAWGAEARAADAYRFDVANGATTLSVSMMHALDALCFVLGEFEAISAVSAVRRSTVRIVEDGRRLPVSAPDHVSLSATLSSGAAASVHYRGGSSFGDNLRWEINGARGDLVITADNGNLQVADLRLQGANADQPTLATLSPAPEFAALAVGDPLHASANVERQYAAIAHDLRGNLREVPDFAWAVHRHRLLAAIDTAAKTGVRQRLG